MSYQRRKFVFTPPIREIREADGGQLFQNEFQDANTDVLSALLPMNVGNRYVIVYELNKKILGFLTFLDRGDHLHLDLVEANQLHTESRIVRPGTALIFFVEGLSNTLGFDKITLHSTQENIDLYSTLGYHRNGEDFEDLNYGTLTPMEKLLS